MLLAIIYLKIRIDETNELRIYKIMLANAAYSISLRSPFLFVYSTTPSLNLCKSIWVLYLPYYIFYPIY